MCGSALIKNFNFADYNKSLNPSVHLIYRTATFFFKSTQNQLFNNALGHFQQLLDNNSFMKTDFIYWTANPAH